MITTIPIDSTKDNSNKPEVVLVPTVLDIKFICFQEIYYI